MLRLDVIREATRLTRAGQLVEATALLQRMLRGERVTDASPHPEDRIALAAGGEPLTIDAKAKTVEEIDRPQPLKPATAQPHVLRALLDRAKGHPGVGLKGVVKRAPSRPDMAPDGTWFIEGTYSSPEGTRTYKLFIPSGYQERPLP